MERKWINTGLRKRESVTKTRKRMLLGEVKQFVRERKNPKGRLSIHGGPTTEKERRRTIDCYLSFAASFWVWINVSVSRLVLHASKLCIAEFRNEEGYVRCRDIVIKICIISNNKFMGRCFNQYMSIIVRYTFCTGFKGSGRTLFIYLIS